MLCAATGLTGPFQPGQSASKHINAGGRDAVAAMGYGRNFPCETTA
jgi:hypothetical protein